ncbi:hypothetical protein BHM03_00061484, partial [Ensete ventricosum]
WPSRHQSRRWDPQTSVSLSAASCRPLPLSSLRNFTCTPSGHRNDLSTLYVPPPAIVLHRPMRGIDDQELLFCLEPEGRRRNYTDALRVFWWLVLLNISLAFSVSWRSGKQVGRERDREREREMVNYWKTKVLPKIKKVFDRNGKKAAAAEACKSFDESKVGAFGFSFFYLFFLVIYTFSSGCHRRRSPRSWRRRRQSSSPKSLRSMKPLLWRSRSIFPSSTEKKIPTELGLKKKSAVVIKFIEELVKIEFPGAKPVSEAASKHGPALVSGPVIFIFEKVSTLLPAEPEPEPEPEPAAAIETTSKEITPEAAVESKKEEAEKAEEEAPAPPAPAEEALAPEPEPAKA